MTLPGLGGLKPYPAMKDSGVGWLGRVPKHWAVERLKSSLANIVEQNTQRRQLDRYIALEHVESWTGRLKSADFEVSLDSQLKRFAPDDVLFGKLRPYLAKVTRPASGGLCVGEFLVLRPRKGKFASSYVEQLLRSRPAVDVIDSSTFGAKMPRADWSFIGSMVVVRPPLTEQIAIVRFLDHAERRIQSYIRAKQKLIGLLEEQKETIIHQVVTGEIDVRTGKPYSAYKPSGVEWLEEVPKHWAMVRNGRLFVQRNEIGFAELPILEISLRTGVRIRDFENSDRKQVMSDRSLYKRAIKGDIAYNMMRMWQGAVGLTPVDGLVSPAYVVAKPLAGADPRYFDVLFRTRRYMAEVDRFSRGIVKDRNRLYWEDFKQMPAPCPPADEQAQIASAVDWDTAIIDEGKQRIEGQISSLREYRTRLIADVVTGTLDVRDAVARLPVADNIRQSHSPPGKTGPPHPSEEARPRLPVARQL